MSWQILLKAQFLPKKNVKRWVEIIASQQSLNKFIKTIKSNDYKSTGIDGTLAFIRGDNWHKLVAEVFDQGIDEQEAEDRFNMVKLMLEPALKERSSQARGRFGNVNRLVSTEEFDASIAESAKIVRGMRSKVKRQELMPRLGELLRSAEIFARRHPEVMKRKKKAALRQEHGATLIPFFEGLGADNIVRANKFQELTGLQKQSEKDVRRAAKGKQTKDVKIEYALLVVFAAQGGQKGAKETQLRRRYTVNPVSSLDAERYFKEVATAKRALVPDDFLRAGLVEMTQRKYRLNPYFAMILKYDTLEEVYRNLNASLLDEIGEDYRRILQYQDRVYPREFADWSQTIEFEDKPLAKIKQGEDLGDEPFNEENQNKLKRLSDTHWQELNEDFMILNASQEVVDLVEMVWGDATGTSELADNLEFYESEDIVRELRESLGDFDSIMENYTEEAPVVQFGRNPKEMLDVLVAGGEAVNIKLGEPNRDSFVELFDEFKDSIKGAVEDKLNDIATNTVKYTKDTVGRVSREGALHTRGKKKIGVYEFLIDKGYLS
jgi:hypothetical protein